MNKIRESLGRVVRNSTAAGLRQPHLERTRLCQLSDAELDPVYVRQRDELRTRVRQLARPKSVNGQVAPYPLPAGSTDLACIDSSPVSSLSGVSRLASKACAMQRRTMGPMLLSPWMELRWWETSG